MVRSAAGTASKWAKAFQDAAPEAIDSYNNALPTMAAGIIAAKDTAKSNFSKALDAPSYDGNVQRGLTAAVAGAGYTDRLNQIAANGFTDAQRAKVQVETEVRRHLDSLIDSIVVAADGTSGNLKFPTGISKTLKRQIVNTNLMKFRRAFTTSTSAEAAIAVFKANASELIDLSVAN